MPGDQLSASRSSLPRHYDHLNPFLFSVLENRILPLYHESIITALRCDSLGEVWTAQRALHYLLLGGLLAEAVWFLNTLGDWKAAFLLAVACEEHRAMSPEVYTRLE